MRFFTPSAVIFVGLSAGIFLSSSLISYTTPPWLLLSTLALAVLLYYFRVRLIALILIAACTGSVLVQSRLPAEVPADYINIHGRFFAEVNECDELSAGRHLSVSILGIVPDSAPLTPTEPFTCDIFYNSVVPIVNVGDTIAFTGYLLPLPDYRDGRVQTDSYTKARHSGSVVEADVDWESLIVTGLSSGSITHTVNRIRYRASSLLAGSALSESSNAMMNALLLGDTSWIDKDTRGSYADSGLAHILAISGLHLAILVGILTWTLYFIHFILPRRAAFVIILIVCWAYALLLGMPVPVTRACLMITILILAKIFRREYQPVHTLFLAADLILIFSPQTLFDTSFLLSFCSVGGIMLLAGKMIPFDPAGHPRLWKASFAITVPLSATLATLPITAVVFGQIPLYFIVANILLMWLIPFILGSGYIFLIALTLGIKAPLLGTIIDSLCSCADFIAAKISVLPGSTLYIGSPGTLSIILYGVFLLLLYCFMTYHRRLFGLGSAAAMCLVIATSLPQRESTRLVFVHRTRFGSSVVLETPPEATVLLADPFGADSTSIKALRQHWINRGIDKFRFERHAINDNGTIIRVINSPLTKFEGRAQIVLIDRHFRGKISQIKESINPDTILLSTNLNTARALRYEIECAESNIPVINLRRTEWHRY